MITKEEIEKAACESNLGYSSSHNDSLKEGVEWAMIRVKNCSIPFVSERFIKLESCDNLGDTFIRFDEKTPIEQWRRIDEMLEEAGLKVIDPSLNAR